VVRIILVVDWRGPIQVSLDLRGLMLLFMTKDKATLRAVEVVVTQERNI
jgi:hypothetical protein